MQKMRCQKCKGKGIIKEVQYDFFLLPMEKQITCSECFGDKFVLKNTKTKKSPILESKYKFWYVCNDGTVIWKKDLENIIEKPLP